MMGCVDCPRVKVSIDWVRNITSCFCNGTFQYRLVLVRSAFAHLGYYSGAFVWSGGDILAAVC